ncbi:2Fe-2S iron-sulfur cluster-binding protein [Curvibacter fontanus]
MKTDSRHTMNPNDTPPFYIGRTGPFDQQFDAWTDRPLLISMEQGGIDWPSSCRNGTCRTCMTQLVSGTVRYEIEWPGLASEEKEEGYVLPCVAHPCSDVTLKEGY